MGRKRKITFDEVNKFTRGGKSSDGHDCEETRKQFDIKGAMRCGIYDCYSDECIQLFVSKINRMRGY